MAHGKSQAFLEQTDGHLGLVVFQAAGFGLRQLVLFRGQDGIRERTECVRWGSGKPVVNRVTWGPSGPL